VAFPPGLLPVQQLSNEEDTGMRVELRRNTAPRKRHQYELRAETDKMSYAGNNFGPQLLPRNKGPRYLVGVHKKGSGTVRLVSAQQLYQMQPAVKQPRLPLEPPEARVEVHGAVAKRSLVSELGSAKAQKKQKSELAKQISPAAVFNSANLTADLAGLAQIEAPKPLTPQQQRPLHPLFNLAAATPLEAYPREGLVPPRVWEAIDAEPLLRSLKNNEPLAAKGGDGNLLWPEFVLQMLQSLPPAKPAKRAAAKQLLYLTYLVRFFGVRRPLRPHDDADSHPEADRMQIQIAPWAQLMADFTEPGRPGKGGGAGAVHKRELTQALRQKLIMHILALALRAADCTLPVNGVAKCLELTPERVCFFLRQLGCSIKVTPGGGEQKERKAILTVPLTFPRAGQGPPARK